MSELRSFAEIVAELDRRVVPAPGNPMGVADALLDALYREERGRLLVFHRGDFHGWDGRCWPEGELRQVRAALYRWLEDAVYEVESKEGPVRRPFEPNRRKIADVLEALQAITHRPQTLNPPAWLDDTAADYPAPELVAMENGLLHLPTRTLLPHTPAYYNEHALAFGYDPDAPAPKRWLEFLMELWPCDEESCLALAEIFGYILAGGTNLQKLLALVGPKRSGKGTIARVITGLLGVHNTCAPTLSSLTHPFGLQPLVGKQLATISDARLGSRQDSLIAVERLLSISGEDYITIDRKYKESWTGRLPTRFLILTNEIPRFSDASGALASRFVMLTMSRSFYGEEDPLLTDKLLAEAPAIFNWALDGLARLQERGHFHQPASAKEALRRLEDLSSPVGSFVRDRCEIGPLHTIEKDQLWKEWKDWSDLEGGKPGTKAVFVRDLVAAYPEIRPRRPRDGASRRQVLQGIRVKLDQQLTEPLTDPDHTAENGSGQGWSGIPSTVSPPADGEAA